MHGHLRSSPNNCTCSKILPCKNVVQLSDQYCVYLYPVDKVGQEAACPLCGFALSLRVWGLYLCAFWLVCKVSHEISHCIIHYSLPLRLPSCKHDDVAMDVRGVVHSAAIACVPLWWWWLQGNMICVGGILRVMRHLQCYLPVMLTCCQHASWCHCRVISANAWMSFFAHLSMWFHAKCQNILD